MKITEYKTLVFDCDGVILNSNKVKTAAFYKAALPYGEKAAEALVEYHVARGGVSRYKKFEWFMSEVVQGRPGLSIDQLLKTYADEVKKDLLNCEVADGLFELREKTRQSNWLIVSGGDQKEINEVFTVRGLDSLFDGGLFGSPDSKEEILNREIASGNIRSPAVFIGDSKYDHLAASSCNLDTLFLSGWSEFSTWPEYCSKNKIPVYLSVKDLV